MHEALLQFLLRAPIGLLKTTLDGTVERINPVAESLLPSLSAQGQADNLFAALAEAAPHLTSAVAAFDRDEGTVCESVRIPRARSPRGGALFLYLNVYKLDPRSLLISVSDTVVDPAGRQGALRREGLGNELRQALAANELFVQYQPVVGLSQDGHAAGALDRGVGVEALVRWNHRILGAVPPLEFVGVAEQYGQSDALSRFVLGTACRQFAQWKKDLGVRAPRALAVNVSAGQLAEPTFADSVSDALDTHEMSPAELQLEVNESVAVQDPAVPERLAELRMLGVVIALDNFGAGHSSLAGLHLLPLDVIKIHRSFVSQAVANAHYRVLIDATLRVARSLRLRTVAEGIETELQLNLVRQLGCEQGQGFYFSEAISPANVAQWLAVV